MEAACTKTQDVVAETYDRDGYYVADRIFTSDECDALKGQALRLLREKANPNSTVYVGVAAASPLYYKLASDPRLVGVLEKIMPEGVAFMSDKFVFKSGQQRFATPWHVDKFYWPNTRAKLSVWIALDKVSADNGALKVVRGSHKKTWQCSRNNNLAQTNNEFVNVVDESQWSAGDEVVCEIEQGSAVFFSDNLIHGSCTNTSGLDRYAIISTYQAPAPEEDFDKIFPARHTIIRR